MDDAARARLIAEAQSRPGYRPPAAWGLGLAHIADGMRLGGAAPSSGGTVLDTWYLLLRLGDADGLAAVLAQAVGHGAGSGTYRLDISLLRSLVGRWAGDGHAGLGIVLRMLLEALGHDDGLRSPRCAVLCFAGDLAAEPADTHEVYLRLHLLSSRLVRPHGQNLAGIFGKLANVCWTDAGPYAAEHFECVRGQLLARGRRVAVWSVDKFPRMTDYVVPSGVRIADADRVRLGAHLAAGTTVMHEGFVNFNAGTLGTSMVEGRISAGVVVDDGSDIGGGASIMGTLSGGGKEVIRIGKKCLLGANAGLGISLGDACTVESGLYITAGSKIRCLWDGQLRKARELSGASGLTFRRNSQDGAIEVLAQANSVVLNPALHAKP
jgi:2,3,4,5-tetrahydropyridine-2-carboxylate N-succinyltransferase